MNIRGLKFGSLRPFWWGAEARPSLTSHNALERLAAWLHTPKKLLSTGYIEGRSFNLTVSFIYSFPPFVKPVFHGILLILPRGPAHSGSSWINDE